MKARYQLKRSTSMFLCVAMMSSTFAGTGYSQTMEIKNTAEAVMQQESVRGMERPGSTKQMTVDLGDIDFSTWESLPKPIDGSVMLDKKFLGAVPLDPNGKNSVTLEPVDGSQVLRLSANPAYIQTTQSNLKITDNFGMEFRVRFGDTTSKRQLMRLKGINQGSNNAWPILLTFDNDGTIFDAGGAESVVGTYKENTWYTIRAEVDTENQVYSAWIDDGTSTISVKNISLNVRGSGDHLWRGCIKADIFEQFDVKGSTEPHSMDIAYFKAGTIKPGIEEIVLEDVEMKSGWGRIVYPYVEPEDSDISGFTYTSADPSIVKTFENGILAMSAGETKILVNDTNSGASSSFKVTVTEDENSWDFQKVDEKTLNYVLNFGRRDQINNTEEQIRELFAAAQLEAPEVYRDMPDNTLVKLVEDDFKSMDFPVSIDKNNYELLTRYLTLMHKRTGEIEYARKAAMILYSQAQHYPHLLLKKSDKANESFAGQAHYGENAVYAFGYLLNMDEEEVWNIVSDISSEEIKETIAEMYIRPMADNCMDYLLNPEKSFGNIAPYGARSTSVAAMVLNDPYLMRKVIMLCDGMMNGNYYYSDGMWHESTISYGAQVSDNLGEALRVMSSYTDPETYEDPENPKEYGLSENVMGIELNETDLSDRWPLLEETKQAKTTLNYPDGTQIAVADTHYNTELDVDRPIQDQYLNNIELPGLGYFGLVQGNNDQAVHAGLLNQANQMSFGSGHNHVNILALTLWGAGTELLPDVGYVVAGNYPEGGKKNLRYPAMKPVLHNMPFVLWEDGENTGTGVEWMKPRLLAYDDGSDNGGIVEMVEASELGTDEAQADINQRLLMNIKLDESSSYVFDLSRMQGGDAHALFQRGSELENMDVETSGIEFEAATEEHGNLLQVAPFKDYTSKRAVGDMSFLYNPKMAESGEDFYFTWTGEESGSRITTYMNGVEGSQAYLSQLPTPRRIKKGEQEKAEALTYFAPHMTRYNKPTSTDTVTKYGAVHETAKAGEENRIESVEWGNPEGFDAMGMVAKITTDTYVDYIYTSGDTEERSYDGITFAGKTAMVRKDRETGDTVYSYVYGGGKADQTTGSDMQTATVMNLSTAQVLPFDDGSENTITVEGIIKDAESYIGKWVQLVFGDGSGYGVKVQNIEVIDGNTILTTEGYVPAKMTDDGVSTLFHPYGVAINGNVTVIFEKSVSGSDFETGGIRIDRLPNKTVYEVGEEFEPEGIKVVASSSNATERELGPDEYDIDASQFNSEKPGTYPITVSYTIETGYSPMTYQVSFKVSVVESLADLYVSKIRVAKKPDKLNYEIDEELDTEGLVVERYQIASSSNAQPVVDVLEEDAYELDYDFSTAGIKKVVVRHEGIGKDGELRDFIDSFFVTIQDQLDEYEFYTTNISVTKLPDKRAYDVNEEIDITGMEVTAYLKATDSNASRKKILSKDEYEIDYNFQTSGKKAVKVSYWALGKDGEEKEFKDSFSVTVKSHSTGADESDDSNQMRVKKADSKWVNDEKGWKLLNMNGFPITSQWTRAVYNGDEDWYRTNKEGYIISGWYLDTDGKWYYMNELHDGYFGAMLVGWRQINGKWYYFNKVSDGNKGCMMKNTWIGSYYLNSEGVWEE